MDQYPVQALAYFIPNASFLPLTTAGSQVLRVDNWNQLYVRNQATSGSSVVSYGKTATGDLTPIKTLSDGTVVSTSDATPGIQKGQCTNANGIGYIDYDDTTFATLDSIAMSAGQQLNIHGLHSFGNVQALVELVLTYNSTTVRLIVGGFAENVPTWTANFAAPIEISAIQDQTVILRVQALRQGRTGQASGRIFARLV